MLEFVYHNKLHRRAITTRLLRYLLKRSNKLPDRYMRTFYKETFM